ncbi:MAG: toxin-antitoxin system protein [Armatimonadetes bacterium]|nr:toxin-antitoxin system protein [Armatimonadota bacterium]
MARDEGDTVQAVLVKAVESYRRRRLLERASAAYEAPRRDPEGWAELQRERAAWDGALLDGLDPEERWTEDGRVVSPDNEGPAA